MKNTPTKNITVLIKGTTWEDLKEAVETAMNTPDENGIINRHHIFLEGFCTNNEGNLETIMES